MPAHPPVLTVSRWVSQLRQHMRDWSKRLPSQCLLCQQWPAQAICDRCWQLHAPPVGRCEGCALKQVGAKWADSPQSLRCGHCLTTPPPWQKAHAAVSYELQWRQLISRYKFHAELGLAVALAERMRTLPPLQAQWAHFDALVPIPMDRRALSARGFNAAERLAHRLDASRVQLHLRRSHATQAPSMAQHQLSRAQRLRNMTGAFHTPDHLHLDGQRLLLIDDVMTTGATLQAATRALLNAGAAHVEVLVFARTEATPAP